MYVRNKNLFPKMSSDVTRGIDHSVLCKVVSNLNPTSHGVSDSVAPMGGGTSEAPPPKKSRRESFLTPCCYIAFLLGKFRGHMQKISQKSQNLSKISGFQKNFKIEISH